MARRLRMWFALLMFGLAAIAPARAQSLDPALHQRAIELLSILRSERTSDTYFAPAFLAQIPAAQVNAIAANLRAQQGDVLNIEAITPTHRWEAMLLVGYQRAQVRIRLTIDRDAPHQVIGLLIAGVVPRGDSAAKLADDFAALPGHAGFMLARLDRGGALPLLAYDGNRAFAIGSGFKLWLLAEASRQVVNRERRWNEVIALGPPSLPSGITQDWPTGSPMTLHSLATLMISISDNSATDTLLYALGRDRVNAMVYRTGHSQPALTLPILSTVEAFALKMQGNRDLRDIWTRGTPDIRKRMLDSAGARLSIAAIDRGQLASVPRSIDSVEWFASPRDMINLLDWLRVNGDPTTRAILAINSVLPIDDARRFRFVGYKGGSEIGVIAMNFLIEARDGSWYAVSAGWNNAAAAVDEARFNALIQRLVAQIPDNAPQ